MADENENQEGDAPEDEQSMDEILGSIREILSDDEQPNGDAQPNADAQPSDDAALAQAETGDVAEAQEVVTDQGSDGDQLAANQENSNEETTQAAIEESTIADMQPEEATALGVEQNDQSVSGNEEMVELSATENGENTEEESSAPEEKEDFLELTEQMIAPSASDVDAGAAILSGSAQNASTDPLQELAKALLNRRDIAIGDRDMTLEGLIREILRPLLREWLDENLPYLIERLVKKEIDHMVNRAERLDL